jgi:hypothetical protein
MRLKAMSLHLALVLGLALAASGCGIKPSELSPPPGKKDTYPRTYPDPSTDPQPEGHQ